MLFNSYEFLFVFLPVTLSIFHILRQLRPTLAVYWLLICSLAFYGYWNPLFLPLLVGSIAANYTIGCLLWRRHRRPLLWAGVALNIVVLAVFKYAHFVADNILGPDHVPEFIAGIVLPLAISFFTFQQIAFLVDVWRGRTAPRRWDTYALYVTFFPHLIAGPIVRHQQLEPQLRRIGDPRRHIGRLVLIGLILVVIGLSKKVILADSLAPYADAVFDIAAQGYEIGMFDAWFGTLAYTLQLYFDFSGYSDMAIGLALMCGLRMPVNFWSPYKATNIVEFWRRWHITLSAFFRDYVYVPLGGSRAGPARRSLNLLLVMALVGLWHGAGWTFLLWGLYHGMLLVIVHGWRSWRSRGPAGSPLQANLRVSSAEPRLTSKRALSWLATFLALCVGWALFRAETMAVAEAILRGLVGQYGFVTNRLSQLEIRPYYIGSALIAGGLVIALVLPNSLQWVQRAVRVEGLRAYADPASRALQRLHPLGWKFGLAVGAMAYLAVASISSASTEFLYFNF
jgi:alginate O-acetyltransferase complex protein AlgI